MIDTAQDKSGLDGVHSECFYSTIGIRQLDMVCRYYLLGRSSYLQFFHCDLESLVCVFFEYLDAVNDLRYI